jgi:Concanavalin A-like lectin/glucanases superfamily
VKFGRAKAAKWLTAALVCGIFLPSQTAPAHAAAPGDTDQALVLNGTSQYASVADGGSHPFNITGSITLEAWVYPTSTCPADQFVITKYIAYGIYCGAGYWKYVFSSDGSSWVGNTTAIKVVPNTWQHIAITHSSGTTTARYYFNGQFAETETVSIPTTIGTNSNALNVGAATSGSNYFQGSIDEVRIYNTAHSDSQILQDMTNYGPTNASDLVAYYDFNDQSGSTVVNVDASPLSNTNLTLVGSPSYSNIESISVVNGDQVITFPRTYLNANGGWRIPSYVSSVRSLVVAGGGAGGSRAGAGGGAGGYVYDAALSVSPNSAQSIIVGQGGTGFVASAPTNGLNSSLGSLRTTLGGGGGGFASGLNNAVRAGHDGGSGGGASGAYPTPNSSAAYGYGKQNSTYGYGSGNNGGSGYNANGWAAGGGGGAGGVGSNSDGPNSVAGKGGAGISDPIAGTTRCYATGGGGGVYYTYTGNNGLGGDCGGTTLGTSPNGNFGGLGSANLNPASTNTGAGGGGNGWNDGSDSAGGYGASGVIILRYPLNMSVTLSYSGGTSATYRTAGTITATTTLAGKVTFYDHGKAIPGCRNVATNGSNIATCTWKPSLHGATTVTAIAKPTNTYVSNGSGYLSLTVGVRTTTR